MNPRRTRELLQSNSRWIPYQIPPENRVIHYIDLRPKTTDTFDTPPGESDKTLSGSPGIIGDEAGDITDKIAEEVRNVAAALEAGNPDHYRK